MGIVVGAFVDERQLQAGHHAVLGVIMLEDVEALVAHGQELP